jgi:hypothetical protein
VCPTAVRFCKGRRRRAAAPSSSTPTSTRSASRKPPAPAPPPHRRACRFWHRHVAILLHAARPELDHDYLAHVLLAPLAADLRTALRGQYPTPRAAAVLDGLVAALLG